MRKLIFLIAGALLLLTIAACTSVKRFKSVDYKGEDNSLVDVDLFNARISAEPLEIREKNLWTLSANAQSHLVQILDERYPDNEEFMSAMAGNFATDQAPQQDLTRKDLRMVFTISKNRDYSSLNDASGRFSPADRIEYMRLSMDIPESYNLRFHEWNRYITEYGDIDIADVSFSRNLDLSVDGSPGGTDLGSEASLGRNEKQVLSKRYLKLNGSISDHRVVIEAEGTREVDLTGNVIADVSLLFDGFPEVVMVPVFTEAEDGTNELAALNFVDILVPAMSDAPDTLFADLVLEYIYRHVASGWLTFAEWDDRVEYYQGRIHKKVPLFLQKDYLPRLFCIGTDLGGADALKFRISPEKEYLLQFRDHHDASRFLEWLSNPERRQTDPVFIGSNKLLYKGAPITPGEVLEQQLKVLLVY
ncbi:MAG: hypothetical protein U9R49_06640 [Bacteroidota bacterium]|nr:hypothetical protein [Bacteroidota bacterium]